MDETLEWKQHPRHTRYLMSEKGDIWDCDRLKAKKTSYDHKNHVRCVCLYQSNREQLNRLVFETFYPDEPLGSAEIIKFEDGDHMNCNYKNLSTTTRSKSCRQWKKGKGYIVHTDKRFSKKLNKQVQYTKYRKLRREQTQTQTMKYVGNKSTDYFFEMLRKMTRLNGGWSHYLGWNDPIQNEEIRKSCFSLYEKPLEECSVSQVGSVLNMRYSAASQFKPNVARFIYSQFPPIKCILDPCSGWGGRCLGAMSLDLDYIGIDSNPDLKEKYTEMSKLYPSNSKITFISGLAEEQDYSKLDYDFVFTSPPYYSKEQYNGMKDYTYFNEEFFFPMVLNSYKNLPNNCWYGLNIPRDMLDDIKAKLGEPTRIVELLKARRNGAGSNYKEYCYFWFKKE